jgi:putative DNA primase/helicase
MTRLDSRAGLCRVSQLRAEPLRWLWPGRLALGKLSLLEGDPGLGKSLISLDLCARLSRGRAFPGGFAMLGPSNALVLNAEGGVADTVRARLAALDADLDRVFVLNGAGPGRDAIGLPGELGLLEDALALRRTRRT